MVALQLHNGVFVVIIAWALASLPRRIRRFYHFTVVLAVTLFCLRPSYLAILPVAIRQRAVRVISSVRQHVRHSRLHFHRSRGLMSTLIRSPQQVPIRRRWPARFVFTCFALMARIRSLAELFPFQVVLAEQQTLRALLFSTLVLPVLIRLLGQLPDSILLLPRWR